MMPCFVCETEYDEKNHDIACFAINKNSGELYEVRSISYNPYFGSKDKTLRLCKNCVHAAAIGGLLATRHRGDFVYDGFLGTEEDYVTKEEIDNHFIGEKDALET